MKGNVKFFDTKKGFGFIEGDDGEEYFVHVTGLQEGEEIEDNDVVEFEVEEGDKGPKAVEVKFVEKAPVDTPRREPSLREGDSDMIINKHIGSNWGDD